MIGQHHAPLQRRHRSKVGDLIEGTGYNIKDANGKHTVIVGTLARITPTPIAAI
jgi:hypothetical protein